MRPPLMRRLALLSVALLLVPLASCVDASAMTLDEMRVTLVRGAGLADSLHVTVPLAVPTGADSARITLTATPGGSFTRTASPQAVAVTFALLAPAEGASVTLRACGLAYRRGVAGPSSCNTQQRYTRPVVAPGPITWPDSMTIGAMQWPDSASVALIEAAWADALPHGPLAAVRGERDTTAQYEWAWWGQALLIRPAPGCGGACRAGLLSDTTAHGWAARNWQEVRWMAATFAGHPGYRTWWDSVRAAA